MKLFFTFCGFFIAIHVFAQTDTARYENGKIKSITTITGDSKEITFFYESGEKSAHNHYKDGLIYVINYYVSGEKSSEFSYKNSNFHGAYLAWHMNGELSEKRFYEEGLQTGKSISMNEKGIVLEERTYSIIKEEGKKKSVLTGKYSLNYSDGKPQIRGNYSKNQRDGKWEEWYGKGMFKELSYWKNGMRAGSYTSWNGNGNKSYEGNFIIITTKKEKKESVADGKHTRWNADGVKVEEGEFVKGKKQGLWVEWFDDGKKKYEKEYKNGYVNGKNLEWYQNGTLAKEEYYLSKLDTSGYYVKEYWRYGKYQLNYNNGIPRETGNYKEGKRDGRWMNYEENGVKTEANYENGLRTGEYIMWNENGRIYSKTTYGIIEDENNKKKSVKNGIAYSYDRNGNLVFKVNYVNDKADGIWQQWYAGGEKEEVAFYKEGLKAGADTFWYASGNLKTVGNYSLRKINDKLSSVRNGEFISYYEDGTISGISYYYNDLIYRTTGFYPNGKLRRECYSFFMTEYGSPNEGFCQEYYSNGQLKEDTYYSGSFPYGRQTQWYMNGNLKAIIDYHKRSDKGNIETVWFSDGNFASAKQLDLNSHNYISLSQSYADSLHAVFNKRKNQEGKVINGLKQGKWLTWFDDEHLQYEMNFKDGKLNGLFTSYFPDGKKMSEFTLVEDIADGKFSIWYPNGKLKQEGAYSNKRPAGVWTNYLANGNKEEEYEYDTLAKRSYRYKAEWYPNGKLQKEITYSRDKEVTYKMWGEKGNLTYESNHGEGASKTYYETGQLKELRNFSDEGKKSHYTFFYENGKKMREQFYVNSEADSIYSTWDENGNKTCEGFFKNGEKDSIWNYYEKGALKKMQRYDDGTLVLKPSPLECSCDRYKKYSHSYIPSLSNGYASLDAIRRQSFSFHDTIGDIYNSLFYTHDYGLEEHYAFDIIAFEEIAVKIPDKNGLKLILNPCDVASSESSIPFNGRFYKYDKEKATISLRPERVALAFSPSLIRQWDKEKNIPFHDENNKDIPSKVYFDVEEINCKYDYIGLEEIKNICFPYSEITNTGIFMDFTYMTPDLNKFHSLGFDHVINSKNIDLDFLNSFVGIHIDSAQVFLSWENSPGIIAAVGKDFFMSNAELTGYIQINAEQENSGLYKIKSEKGNISDTMTGIENYFKSKGFQDLDIQYEKAGKFLKIFFTYKK